MARKRSAGRDSWAANQLMVINELEQAREERKQTLVLIEEHRKESERRFRSLGNRLSKLYTRCAVLSVLVAMLVKVLLDWHGLAK